MNVIRRQIVTVAALNAKQSLKRCAIFSIRNTRIERAKDKGAAQMTNWQSRWFFVFCFCEWGIDIPSPWNWNRRPTRWQNNQHNEISACICNKRRKTLIDIREIEFMENTNPRRFKFYFTGKVIRSGIEHNRNRPVLESRQK